MMKPFLAIYKDKHDLTGQLVNMFKAERVIVGEDVIDDRLRIKVCFKDEVVNGYVDHKDYNEFTGAHCAGATKYLNDYDCYDPVVMTLKKIAKALGAPEDDV